MTPGVQVFWAIYFIAALVYAIYSDVTESGLGAYLIKLEMDFIGGAEKTITIVLTFFVLLAPLWAITRIVGKLSPLLVWQPADDHNRSQAGQAKPGLMERLNRPVQAVSWKMIFGITAIPILLGAVIVPALYYYELRDQREKVYSIDLTSGVADLPKEARYIELTGLMARSYALTFKRTFNSVSKSHELFAPVTANGWPPADPVRYFVRDRAYEVYDRSLGKSGVRWPDAFRRRGAATFSGKISRSLPAFVESEYQSKGLKLDPSYSVVEWMDLRDPKVPSTSHGAALAAGICLLLAVSLFLINIMVKIMLASMRKKQRAYTAG